ncbi:MAG: dihydrofolate reductase family protein [Caldisericia bacterium]|nr:dihydrofolate reductase family protein [Caldisericia bacterium]
MMKVIIHNAIGIDGRNIGLNIDLESFFDQDLHYHEDVVLVNIETISKIEMKLDGSGEFYVPNMIQDDKRPALAVVDDSGMVRCWKALMESGYWKEYYAIITKQTNHDYVSKLVKKGIQPIVAGEKKVDMKHVIEILDKELGFEMCRLDPSGELNSAMLDLDLVDEVSLVVIPMMSDSNDEAFAISKRMKHFKFLEGKSLENGVVWLRYRK